MPLPEARSLTQELIELIRGKAVGREDLEKTALYVLDAVANALAGRNSEPGRKLLEWGKGRQGDAGRRPVRVAAGRVRRLDASRPVR